MPRLQFSLGSLLLAVVLLSALMGTMMSFYSRRATAREAAIRSAQRVELDNLVGGAALDVMVDWNSNKDFNLVRHNGSNAIGLGRWSIDLLTPERTLQESEAIVLDLELVGEPSERTLRVREVGGSLGEKYLTELLKSVKMQGIKVLRTTPTK